MTPKQGLMSLYKSIKKGILIFPPFLYKSVTLSRKEKGDKQKIRSAFEARLPTKDLLNQFNTRNRTQAVLRKVSQRSTEKGSLKAEAGDVSILKMEIEDSSEACARSFSRGQQRLAAPWPFQHRPFKEGQNTLSRHESQISQLPAPWAPTLPASTRPTVQWPPAENKKH